MGRSRSTAPASVRARGYLPAIDGLRALAVVAVVLYHLNLSAVPGGFLGVDVFFVISGYVITTLLLNSITAGPWLDFGDFYRARVRRLLPALLVVVGVVGLAAGLGQVGALPLFVRDVPAALLGVENWALLLRDSDYFAVMGRPSLLQHTWSLAIEAQFYLLWPVVLLIAYSRGGRRAVSRTALFGAGLSATGMLVLATTAAQSAASHLYYGTDTHSFGLLIGCALAVSWGPERLGGTLSHVGRAAVDAVGAVALAVLLLLFAVVQDQSSRLFHWSFLLASVAAALLLAALVHPASRLAGGFRVPALRWLGTRSYSIYLWHWPIFEMTRPGIDVQGDAVVLGVLRVAATLLAAEATYRLVETPFRRGLWGRWWERARSPVEPSQRWRFGTVAGGVAVVLAAIVAVDATALVTTSRSSSAVSSPEARIEQMASQSPDPSTSPTAVVTPATDSATSVAVASLRLDGFGDSVLLGVKATLARSLQLGDFDAVVGRQADALVAVVQQARLQPGDVVLLNIGNNGYAQRSQMRAIFDVLRDQPRVVVVNTAVPRIWRDRNNEWLAQVAQNYANVRVVDWNSVASTHPEYLAGDGVHLSRDGVRRYAGLILDVLAQR